MEKLKSNTAAKIIAMILTVVSIAAFAAGAAGIIVMESGGIYREEKSEMLKQAYELACRKYSIKALADYQGDFNQEELGETNFRYGVIKADDIGKVDLSKPESYLVRNFDEAPDENNRYIFERDIDEYTNFVCGKNLWDPFYVISDYDGDWYQTVEYPIEGYCYDKDSEGFYIRSGKQLFLMDAEAAWLFADEDTADRKLDNSLLETVYDNDSGKEVDIWDEDYDTVMVEGWAVPLNEIRITDSAGLAEFGKPVDYGRDEQYLDSVNIAQGSLYMLEKQEIAREKYYVVSYSYAAYADSLADSPAGPSAQLQPQGKPSLRGDMFMQAKRLIDFVYQMRYAAAGILVLSLIMFLASFVFLMLAAGHRRGQEGICPRFLDKAPLDLYLACVGMAEFFLAVMAAFCIDMMIRWDLREASTMRYCLAGAAMLCAGAAGIMLAAAYCMSFAVNVKLGKWWQRTVIYWCLKKCISAWKAFARFCVRIAGGFLKSMTLLWKAWLLLGGIAFVEYLVIVSTNWHYDEFLFFWCIEKLILYPVIIFLLLQMNRLQKGAQRIAGGSLDYQIDTSRMFWEVKKHGEYLNDIQIGMNRAVNERMKSERFKTELITNVSHDIKTPLTSIINYVDLLQKEQIENPRAQEYLEVLRRQSARLKKLIEDLMEASKASTGSISVIMEQCDTGVMLVQTVGEFEEKLMAEQIELQIKKPEQSILIEADSRHLWRVFDNLMNNICKYAQPMTRAYVNLEQDGQQAVITFRNISKYQLNISSEELMERFVRGDSSRSTEGSGLGISIARSLTELMNGTFALVVDGDLFKVILTFPLYGTGAAKQGSPQAYSAEGYQRQGSVPDGQTAGFAGNSAYAQEPDAGFLKNGLAAGIQNAGAHAKNFGHGVADKTGRMFRRAGRFAQNVKQAAEMTKAEETEEAAQETDDVENVQQTGLSE